MAQDPRASEDVEPSFDEHAQHEEVEQQEQHLRQQDREDSDDTESSHRQSAKNENIKNSTAQDADPEQAMARSENDYDFEVKEQDRWLPIANGESLFLPVRSAFHLNPASPTITISSRRRTAAVIRQAMTSWEIPWPKCHISARHRLHHLASASTQM